MCYVEVRPTDDKRSNFDYLEMALRELKRKMKKENVFQDLKQKEFYRSPSEKKKFRRQEALKRRKREDNKTEWVRSNKS